MRRMNITTPRRCRSGWTLVHMVLACSLVGMFMLGASRVFMMTHGTIRQSQQGLTAIHQSQSMVGYLRSDVWSAKKMAAIGERSLELTLSDDSMVIWQFNEASFARSVKASDGRDEPTPDANANADVDAVVNANADAARSRRWSIEVARAAFTVEGPVLVLNLFNAKDKPAGELRLTSQVLLAQALQPDAAHEKGGAP